MPSLFQHEMIHAYLFIQNIREGNGGHGPNFKRIMENINRVAGTNITVYHTFHDEVALYKTHIWRCNGICQHRKPFYGWVKRTSNRAPGPNDNWWAKHHETCSGTFVKVSQPEPKQKAKKAKVDDKSLPKITNWLNSPKNSAKPVRPAAGGFTKMNGGGTVVQNPTTSNKPATVVSNADTGSVLAAVSDASAGGHLRNVVGFRDMTTPGTENDSLQHSVKAIEFLSIAIKLNLFYCINALNLFPLLIKSYLIERSVIQKPPFSSSGRVLGSSSSNVSSNEAPSEKIRNIWANKFRDTNSPASTSTASVPSTSGMSKEEDSGQSAKRTKVTEATSAWEEIDDDILIHNVQNTIIEINDDNSNDAPATMYPVADVKPQISIKKELLDDLGEDDENIEMIDDEFDDTLNESADLLTDHSVIDELFGTDTLMADFNNINDVVMNDPENIGNADREIVTCPICEDRMERGELTCHLDGCNGITVKIDPRRRGGQTKPLPFYKNKTKPSTKPKGSNKDRQVLLNAGYSHADIEKLFEETQAEKDYNDRIMDEMSRERRPNRTTSVITSLLTNNDIETISIGDESNSPVPEKQPCPVCNSLINANHINEHLDECLQGNA